MKPLRTLTAWLLLVALLISPAPAEVVYKHTATGATLFTQFQIGATTYKGVAMTEDPSYVYKADDTAIDGTSGFPSTDGDLPFWVYTGSATDTPPSSQPLAVGVMGWAGTVERPLRSNVTHANGSAITTSGAVDANVTQFGGVNGTFSSGRPEVNTTHWAGAATATDDIALLSQLGSANFADAFLTAAKIATDAITAAKIAAAAINESEAPNLDAPVSEAGGGGGGGPIEQRTVASERILVVTRNADTGDLIVGSKVKMKASEQFLYALEFKGTLLAPGTNLFGMSTPTLSGTDAANMEVEDSGVLGTQAKFEVSTTSGAAVDDEITITVPVQLSATETINVEVEVEIRP